jgi:hypothetical protein
LLQASFLESYLEKKIDKPVKLPPVCVLEVKAVEFGNRTELLDADDPIPDEPTPVAVMTIELIEVFVI